MMERDEANRVGTAWSTDQVVRVVRDLLRGSGAVGPSFRLDAVWPENDELLVAFRWCHDPNRYAVRLPLPKGTGPEGPWTGLPVDSATEWAQEVAGLFGEELRTGAVRRARRHRQHGVVELDWCDVAYPGPPGYYCSTVVLPETLGSSAFPWPRADFGRSLEAVGLDVTVPRRHYRQGGLLSWLKVSPDTASPEPVGHASAAWCPDRQGIATLDVLQVLRGVPDAVASYLARMLVHDAAEAGAERIHASCAHPQLAVVGFRQEHPAGPVTVDTTEL